MAVAFYEEGAGVASLEAEEAELMGASLALSAAEPFRRLAASAPARRAFASTATETLF